MSISSQDFRDALSHFPSGVTIVTIKSGENIHGLTVSAFASVSPEPPLIAIIIDHRHLAFNLLEDDGACFAVNILHQDQIDLSNRFAWLKDQDRFKAGEWSTAVTWSANIDRCLSLVGLYHPCSSTGRDAYDLRRACASQQCAAAKWPPAGLLESWISPAWIAEPMNELHNLFWLLLMDKSTK